jgi:Flp pilus assembly pilin Flp
MLGNMIGRILCILHDRKGVSSLEYAILAVAILGGLTAVIANISTDVGTLFTDLYNAIHKALPTPAGG